MVGYLEMSGMDRLDLGHGSDKEGEKCIPCFWFSCLAFTFPRRWAAAELMAPCVLLSMRRAAVRFAAGWGGGEITRHRGCLKHGGQQAKKNK